MLAVRTDDDDNVGRADCDDHGADFATVAMMNVVSASAVKTKKERKMK